MACISYRDLPNQRTASWIISNGDFPVLSKSGAVTLFSPFLLSFSLSPSLFFPFFFFFSTLGHFYTEYPPERLCNISCMYLSPRREILSNPQAGKEAACMHQAVTSTLGQCRGTRHFYHFLYARCTYTMACLAVNMSSTIEAQIQPPKKSVMADGPYAEKKEHGDSSTGHPNTIDPWPHC